jgi:hypothetical protein
MSKKSKLNRYRNFTYFRLFGLKCNLSSLLITLESDYKCITDEEKEQLLELRDKFNELLSNWKNSSNQLLNQIKE